MNTEQNNYTTTTTTGSGNFNYQSYANFCAHRLPCGYCSRMGSWCPLNNNPIWSPTWEHQNEVTCEQKP